MCTLYSESTWPTRCRLNITLWLGCNCSRYLLLSTPHSHFFVPAPETSSHEPTAALPHWHLFLHIASNISIITAISSHYTTSHGHHNPTIREIIFLVYFYVYSLWFVILSLLIFSNYLHLFLHIVSNISIVTTISNHHTTSQHHNPTTGRLHT